MRPRVEGERAMDCYMQKFLCFCTRLFELELFSNSFNKKFGLWSSSFLKQHSNEEAIFRSFRDINELIKDMLDLKGKYTTVETELREMHDRYSQLSLQFAEVEGERQKLMMTVKNVRASRKLLNANNRPSCSPRRDHSPL